MNELHTIECVYYWAQIIAVIIGLLGVVVATIGICKYIEYKRIDALIGFYAKLSRMIRLFTNTLGNVDDNLNIFYAFCENEELRTSIPASALKSYEFYRTELLNLILHSDNQIEIGQKKWKWKRKNTNGDISISDLIDKLIDELNHYSVLGHPQVLFNIEGQRQADEANVKIKNILSKITSKVVEEKKNLIK